MVYKQRVQQIEPALMFTMSKEDPDIGADWEG